MHKQMHNLWSGYDKDCQETFTPDQEPEVQSLIIKKNTGSG